MVRTYIDPLFHVMTIFIPTVLIVTTFLDYINGNINFESIFEDIILSLLNTFYILLPAIIIMPIFFLIVYSSAMMVTLRGLRQQQRHMAVRITTDGISWKNDDGGFIFSPWSGIQKISKQGGTYRIVVKTGCYPGIRIFVPASIFDEEELDSILAFVGKGK